LSSDILTCRCRHCGNTFPYPRSSAGATAECPECHKSVQLPGRLASVATKRRSRITSVPGLILEIGGFLVMLWFPLGTIAGLVFVIIGFKQSYALRCSNCETPAAREASRCGNCRAAFTSE
jgi:uncharacterized paraquat-inducible protein A